MVDTGTYPQKAAMLEKLTTEIIEAFPAKPLDTDTFFDPRETWKSYINVDEFESACLGKTWLQLNQEYIEDHADALGFLSPAAYASILPACLKALVGAEPAEGYLPVFAFRQLTRRETWEEVFDARLDLFTEQQRIVIERVLEELDHSNRYPYFADQVRAALNSWRDVLKSRE